MNKDNKPKILYHYTNQEGLTGIIKESVLWATKIHFLNDATELVKPLKIADDYLFEIAYPDYGGEYRDTKTAKYMLKQIKSWENINICIASFCSSGDILSQWRGYSTFGSSYSIGFNTEIFESIVAKHSFKLHKCSYFSEEEYERNIIDFIKAVLIDSNNTNKEPTDFIGRFINKAATIKLDYFQEENEWRIISWEPKLTTDNNFNFRTGKSMIIPYFSIPIDLSSVVEIAIGPCQNPDLARNAVYGLITKYNLVNVQLEDIKISSIPYRPL